MLLFFFTRLVTVFIALLMPAVIGFVDVFADGIFEMVGIGIIEAVELEDEDTGSKYPR